MSQSNPNPHIGGSVTADRAKTLELVFGRLPAEDRRQYIDELFASANSSDAGPFGGLLEARRNGQLVGAAFSQLLPDNNASIWLPRLINGEPESTATSLLSAACEWLSQKGVSRAQVLLHDRNKSDESLLRAGGFHRLTSLLYLVAPKRVCCEATPAAEFNFEPYVTAKHDRFVRALEATYEATHDCAESEDARSGESALIGYRSIGDFDPRHWLLVRDGGRDVGCLLLADHPRHGNMELLYLGLTPAARRRGWGTRLARHAQWLAASAGRARLVLAVDRANRPAIQTYTAVGFQAWDRRRVYVRYAPLIDSWHASFRQVIHAGCASAPRISQVARTAS